MVQKITEEQRKANILFKTPPKRAQRECQIHIQNFTNFFCKRTSHCAERLNCRSLLERIKYQSFTLNSAIYEVKHDITDVLFCSFSLFIKDTWI